VKSVPFRTGIFQGIGFYLPINLSLQFYSSAFAYELISQLRLTSSNCGVVQSMISLLACIPLAAPALRSDCHGHVGGYRPKISNSVCVPTNTCPFATVGTEKCVTPTASRLGQELGVYSVASPSALKA
jgi:hypothetical protein